MIPNIQDHKHHKFIYTDTQYNLLSAVSVLAANVADKCHGSSQQNMNRGFVFALTEELPIDQSIPGAVTYLKEKEKL
jgi:hypothetical protein